MAGRDRESGRIKSRYRKLLRELKYLYSELEYYTEEHEYRKQEFNDDFLEFCEDYGYDCNTRKAHENFIKKQIDPYRASITDDETSEIEKELPLDTENTDTDDPEKELKRLYKKIATQTHPDKLTKEEVEATKDRKHELFLNARRALENKDFYQLVLIAEELGIDLPAPTRQQLVWMRKEKKKIEKIMEEIRQTFEWIYGEEDVAVPRINLFYRYVELLGCVKLEKEG